jgi:acyl-[acyl-carrier-protein] desaturase
MLSRALKDKFHREYMTFFENAERARRWNLFTDIDWSAIKNEPRNDKLALCAETFCGVEMYLPDYIDGHLTLFRDSFGPAWFAANWGYEESKHALTLWKYLVTCGYRTEEQMHAYSDRILSVKWNKPFDDPREMTAYGCAQEMTTFVIYKKQQLLAEAEGNPTLASAYKLIAKDEMAHAQYYMTIMQHYLDDDRAGSLEALSNVFYNFKMPAYELVPDYDSRVEVMRTAGIDRGVFLTEVWGPVLKRFKLTRHDLPKPRRVRAALDAGKSEALKGEAQL